MGIALERLAVVVTGDVDGRGTLGEPQVPVGFQSLRLEVQLVPAPGTSPRLVERLLAAAERHCEVLQTLRNGAPIEVIRNGG